MKKIALLSITMSILVTGSVLCSSTATAETLQQNISHTIIEEQSQKIYIQSRSAGMLIITSKSGANIRSGAGLNYNKIGVANWGDEIDCGRDYKYDSRGVRWYHITNYKGIKSGWISSEVAYVA